MQGKRIGSRMECLSVDRGEVAAVADKDWLQTREYERRLELSLTEKERADAVNLIVSMFKQRLQDHGSKVSQ